MNILRTTLLTLAFAQFLLPAQAETPKAPVISDIHEIHLKNGITPIPNMTADGKSGIAVKAWRQTHNNSGYNRYLFMINDKDDHNNPWKMVSVYAYEYDQVSARDSLIDTYTKTEDTAGAVYLANAKVDGKSELIALEAYRDNINELHKPAGVTLKTYRLKTAQEGSPSYQFAIVSIFKSKRKYGNVNCALEKEFAIIFTPETKAEDTACRQ